VSEPEKTDAETAAHIREWCSRARCAFSWPTDGCGYEQHMKFVTHRNLNWHGSGDEAFTRFCLDYADSLERR
jgi:hypothetical protein